MQLYHISTEGADGEILGSFLREGAKNLRPDITNYEGGQGSGFYVFTNDKLPRNNATGYKPPIGIVGDKMGRACLLSIEADPSANPKLWRPDLEIEGRRVYQKLRTVLSNDEWRDCLVGGTISARDWEHCLSEYVKRELVYYDAERQWAYHLGDRNDPAICINILFNNMLALGGTVAHARILQHAMNRLQERDPERFERINAALINEILDDSKSGDSHALKYIGRTPLPVSKAEILTDDGHWETVLPPTPVENWASRGNIACETKKTSVTGGIG